MIVTEYTLPDPDDLLASFGERQRDLSVAGRQAMLEFLQAYVETASDFADSQEQLASATNVEWLSRLLRAQAAFTREVLEASRKFAQEVMDE
jgi:hypothetical protein